MKQYDLLVAGGGLSGVAAAVAAARQGLSVLLVEQSGSLGGAMSNALVYPFMRFWTQMPDGSKKLLSDGLFTEMRRRQAAYAKTACFQGRVTDEHAPPAMDFQSDLFKFALDDMVAEAGVTVLYHATLFRVNTQGRKVCSVLLATKAGELEVSAAFFVDATGDGDLLAFAGCDYQLGRESDGLCQPMTTCFRMANVDERSLGANCWKEMNALYRQLQQAGKICNPRENILKFRGQLLGEGIIHFNTTRVVKLDPTDPFAVSQAEALARKQVWELVAFLKENDFPAFRNAYLVSCATHIGVRESRKLKGVHILTAQELMDCTRFPDSIALGDYDIDIHNPEGSGTSHYYFQPGTYYTIPYRSLLPKEFDNLLVAGRCISATHEAQASIRIMPICATLGEAAGTAVGIAWHSGTDVHTLDIAALQAKLRENGAAID